MVSTVNSSPRMSALHLVCGLVGIAMAHVGYTFVLYRARVLTHSGIASSDFFLFVLPALLAFSGYFLLLRARAIRVIPPWVAAFLLTLLSFSLSLLLPFSIYGT
jgi:hypothetical protein